MAKLSLRKGSAMLVTDKLSREYFVGELADEGYLIITGDKTVLFTDARYYYETKSNAPSNIEVRLFEGLNSIDDYLKAQTIKTLYLDFTKVTVSEYLENKKLGLKIKDGSKKLIDLRAIKSAKEIRLIKKACEIVQNAFYKSLTSIKLGMTEIELKKIVNDNFLALGADGLGFDTIVAFGKNASVPHHVSDNTVLDKNCEILIETGAKYSGYISDLTRTVYFGEPSEEFKRNYEAVLRANQTAIDIIKVGTVTCEADGFARNVLEKHGLKEYFTHSQRHGVGLEIHEKPTLSPKRKYKLKNRMVFTIEPGVYLDGKSGIRIEDTVVLKDGKVQRLFTDDKKMIIIKN